MSYYEDVYLRRINRFGTDYKSRVQGQREKVFEDLLLKSLYRVDFVYDGKMEPALLERYKQDDTQILQYLLTRLSLNLHGGDLLEITDQDGRTKTWMVYWLEYIEASGYNRYVVMEMKNTIKWTHDLGKQKPKYFSQLGYFFGKRRLAISDDVKGKTKGKGSLYLEDTSVDMLIMPFTPNLKKDDYFELKVGDIVSPYRVTGIDNQSTEGVQFVSVAPSYEYDKSPNPQKPVNDNSGDYDWFTGKFKED